MRTDARTITEACERVPLSSLTNLIRSCQGHTMTLPENACAAVVPQVRGYEWAFSKLRDRALDHMHAVVIAARNGMGLQKDMHIKALLDVYHQDLVYGYVVPVLRDEVSNFNSAVIYDEALPGLERHSWERDHYLWWTTPAPKFQSQIPPSAFLSLAVVNEIGIPFADFHVVETAALPWDPYLAGRIGKHLVAFTYWV